MLCGLLVDRLTTRSGIRLEAVDQIKLHTPEIRLGRARRRAGRYDCMLQINVKGASKPQSVGGSDVVPQLPGAEDPVLQDIRWSSLIALNKRCNRGVLLLPGPGVPELEVILVPGLP